MLTWKVWADDDDLLFEGCEADARAYVTESPGRSEFVLESPDGDSYRHEDGSWLLLGPYEVSQYH